MPAITVRVRMRRCRRAVIWYWSATIAGRHSRLPRHWLIIETRLHTPAWQGCMDVLQSPLMTLHADPRWEQAVAAVKGYEESPELDLDLLIACVRTAYLYVNHIFNINKILR